MRATRTSSHHIMTHNILPLGLLVLRLLLSLFVSRNGRLAKVVFTPHAQAAAPSRV